MNKSDRALIRTFYQSIPTSGEKALFLQVLTSARESKIGYLEAVSIIMTPEQRAVFMAVTALSKEDRAEICGQVARGFIMKALYWVMGW